MGQGTPPPSPFIVDITMMFKFVIVVNKSAICTELEVYDSKILRDMNEFEA
jgi:hypothetical protein